MVNPEKPIPKPTTILVKSGLLIVLLAWFVYTAYWFIRGLSFEDAVTLLNRTTTWDFYSGTALVSEVTGTIMPGLRTFAGIAAIAAFVMYVRGKSARAFLRWAILLEAIGFILFLPSGIRFLKAPWLFDLTVDALTCIVEAIIIPIPLLILRSKLTKPENQPQAIKWAFMAGISYLAVFWLNYSGQWFAAFTQPELYNSAYPGFGLKLVTDYLLNMFNFLLTAVGLLMLTLFFAWKTLQVARNPVKLPFGSVGAVLTLFGLYLIVTVLLFSVFGAVGGKSIPYVYMLDHNVDNWAVTLPFVGVCLILWNKRNR